MPKSSPSLTLGMLLFPYVSFLVTLFAACIAASLAWNLSARYIYESHRQGQSGTVTEHKYSLHLDSPCTKVRKT